ncbi:MAG: Sau3AI family type II restriction endonuclease [Anaerostipes sp.]|jgi:DNA mismatch repair protein MutH|nr:Sau3AI family type II restriction endonuclease [Anaerostipes sp.]
MSEGTKVFFDECDPISIETYSQNMVGKTFAEICDEDDREKDSILAETSGYKASHENKKRKGGLGELIEERFFHYAANNDSQPDFDKAGVELKVTPYKVNKNGSKSAKERLIITMIDYCNVINEKFEESHLWGKAQLILLVYYLYEKEIKNRLDYRINYAKLFTPPAEDLKIIKHDYKIIIEKIKAGKAHELSEGDTMYLGAAPKAATSKNRRKQPYSDELAKPRAFAFKNSYMTYVLNNYIISGKSTYESIIKESSELSFEDYVMDKIDKYNGYSVGALCKEFNVEYRKNPKNLEAMLAYRMLGIKGNHAEEFEKANIVVKTIRITNKNKIKENMSFPNFKFKELVEEEWEDSTFGNYLEETRFLFVVYKFDDDNNLILKGCQFWNIPYEDLENQVKKVWKQTKKVLIEGLEITQVGKQKRNNFPKKTDNAVCHVRPHGRNAEDVYELPDGRVYTKQCFWLNNDYILKQIKRELIEN